MRRRNWGKDAEGALLKICSGVMDSIILVMGMDFAGVHMTKL